MGALKERDVRRQSECVIAQFGDQWREHAKIHSKYPMHSLEKFKNIGFGRAVLSIANGYSFEENIETIKKYRHNVDILVCDKTLKPCIDNGIFPDYCFVCDANVSFEKYLDPVKDKLQNTVLFMNVCGNPKWTESGNWKEIYFVVNKDVLHSEIEFQHISGCPNVIAAGTNVSNAQIILLTQSDNSGRSNFFGYDKILMIGYDYSWDKDKYYAFDGHGGGKQHYMKQAYCYNLAGDFIFSSTNLIFSAKWLEQYIEGFKLPVIQCSKRSITKGFKVGDLAEQMQYRYKPEDSGEVISLMAAQRELQAKIDEMSKRLFNISMDHAKQVIRTT